jgi:ribosome recycling factor
MTNDILAKVRSEFSTAIARLEEELKKVRTGRAHASMLDGIMITVYGSEMPLVAVGSIAAPEAQLLQITPFDAGNLQAVAQAIRDDQSLGLNPVDDGRVIRIQIPALTTERRQQLVKQLGEKSEECMVRMRSARHDALKEAKKAKDDKAISQDDEHRLEKQIDDLMAEMKTKVDSAISTKEKEILTL